MKVTHKVTHICNSVPCFLLCSQARNCLIIKQFPFSLSGARCGLRLCKCRDRLPSDGLLLHLRFHEDRSQARTRRRTRIRVHSVHPYRSQARTRRLTRRKWTILYGFQTGKIAALLFVLVRASSSLNLRLRNPPPQFRGHENCASSAVPRGEMLEEFAPPTLWTHRNALQRAQTDSDRGFVG